MASQGFTDGRTLILTLSLLELLIAAKNALYPHPSMLKKSVNTVKRGFEINNDWPIVQQAYKSVRLYTNSTKQFLLSLEAAINGRRSIT